MERDSGFHDDLLQSYSETELVRRVIGSSSLAPGISLLSSNFLAKHYKPDEVEDMIDATDRLPTGHSRSNTKRIIRNGPDAYCVIDRIPGRRLEGLWTHIS